ncbi:MAG TPA: sulfatase-like hydrolase/transferase [Candidatus Hydrogenedentes bacterium]|nr:sulfatase-like hydrolase/transferase [Candidatus Hydrogenedentota bacterium]HPG65541.1 sulfatase-like hydrolase/transferase [Candidatus Hydrogenedentota bacterium]
MKKFSRRTFLSTTGKILASAPLAGALGTLPGCPNSVRPNILVLMVDQMRTPPEGYGDNEGAAAGLKEVLGFRPLSEGNEYAQYFPGLLRLRQNGVVMTKHFTAAAACVPSRTCIMTGQYPKETGVTQTDGVFKSGCDVSFLDPAGTPTIGHWFRAAGYETHYFGKWHVSEAESPDFLDPWGFDDWEQSAPEPHGGMADNLGVFRDIEFTNAVTTFLSGKSVGASQRPWLAVGSLVNPHDISAYPINWQTPNQSGVVGWENYPPVTPIPAEGDVSRLGGVHEENVVELNPDNFPQNNSALPRTYSESLDDKPRCQKDYALKWGLAIESSTNYGLQGTQLASPLPFQLQGDNAEAWSLGFNQFYFYCQYLADLQLRKILEALDENGMADNTIVVFLSDHGELGGSHGGMIQKWHNAYEEVVRVPMVISSPLVNRSETNLREIDQPTSSIDLAPTLLGLAGLCQEELRGVLEEDRGTTVKALAGADLSDHVRGCCAGCITDPDGEKRTGVFFMSDDMVTEKGANPVTPKPTQYELFLANVEQRIGEGLDLASGPVCQPNNVRALCTGDWKMVHYVDPTGVEADEWELYCLKYDPVEETNLVDFQTGELRNDVTLTGLSPYLLESKHQHLKAELARREAMYAPETA